MQQLIVRVTEQEAEGYWVFIRNTYTYHTNTLWRKLEKSSTWAWPDKWKCYLKKVYFSKELKTELSDLLMWICTFSSETKSAINSLDVYED